MSCASHLYSHRQLEIHVSRLGMRASAGLQTERFATRLVNPERLQKIWPPLVRS